MTVELETVFLLVVSERWTEAASAGDLEEVY